MLAAVSFGAARSCPISIATLSAYPPGTHHNPPPHTHTYSFPFSIVQQKSNSLEERLAAVTAELELTQKRAQAASDKLSDHMAVFGSMEAESFRMKVCPVGVLQSPTRHSMVGTCGRVAMGWWW